MRTLKKAARNIFEGTILHFQCSEMSPVGRHKRTKNFYEME